MPLFVDPRETVRIEFGAECRIPELRGEWMQVLASIGDGEWQELKATSLQGYDGDEVKFAFDRATVRRMTAWIVGFSFSDRQGKPYPTQNREERARWLATLFPPAAEVIRDELTAHITKAWAVAQPETDPKLASSEEPTASTPTNGSGAGLDISTLPVPPVTLESP